jgi:WD40 repeat protein
VNNNCNLIASGSKDSEVLIWDTRSSQIVNKFEGHRQEICGLKFSADGNYLASGGNDNIVFVWEPRMNKYIGKLT